MEEAVAELLKLDARQSAETDIYPIVTLATRHINALVKRGKLEEAKRSANTYFARLQELERVLRLPFPSGLKQQLMTLVTTGVWHQGEFTWFAATHE